MGKLVKWTTVVWTLWVAWLYYRDNVRPSYRPG